MNKLTDNPWRRLDGKDHSMSYKPTAPAIDDTLEVRSLRESERLYRSLFENMLNGFAYCRMLFDDGKPLDFVYLAVNPAFEAQTGLKDVVGKKMTEIFPGIRESDPQPFEVFGRVARIGNAERFEVFVKALQMWFSLSVYCPAPEHFVAVFDVITERKRAELALREFEERFATVFRSSPVALSIASIETLQHVDVNEMFTHSFGFSREEIIGHTSQELQLFSDSADGERLLAEVLKQGFAYCLPMRFRTKAVDLADVLWGQGKKDEAREQYRRYRELSGREAQDIPSRVLERTR
jgi:PAS domain-containing protein